MSEQTWDDPEPQPGDGPDYHAEHAAWATRANQRGCAQCGATSTELAYYPGLLGWFCIGNDGAGCYPRKVEREGQS